MLTDDRDSNALLESEQQLKQAEEEAPQPAPRQVNFTKYFTYLTFHDKLLLGVGTAGAIIAGAILPSISLVMGNVAVAFTGGGGTGSDTNLLAQMGTIASIVMMIAMLLFVFSYIFFAFWQHLAENITLDLRKRYIASLMRQEIGYFEVNKVEQIPAQISEIFDTIKSSIGEKISNLIFACSTCIFGMVYAIVYGPVFALICIAYLPLLLGIIGFFGRQVQKSTLAKLKVVKNLGGIAEETLTAIKVVCSFTREDREMRKFARHSRETMEVGKNASATMALMVGLMKFSIFFFYSYALFVGSFFIENMTLDKGGSQEYYNQQVVIQTLIALITGFVGLIAALPNVQAIVAAKTLGVLIFDVIERQPEVRNCTIPERKVKLDDAITFDNVTFKYPTSLPEHKPVLIDATFSIKAGETTAIVGPSGSGKSTIVQLVERFYDPRPGGQVQFDGTNIRNLDLKVLRENIGYVSQEPVMIMGTIRDNLLFGNCDATQKEMEEALRQANASFVFDQENGLDTFVGTAGIMNMSGGQKQRIAIARALIKKPKILILDEATSALDPKSEIEVQAAIEQIAKSGSALTILIIAHRLTTIASADNLLYFQSRSNLVSAAKGTPEYDEIFEKLKSISYAMGDPEDNDDEMDEEDLIEEQRQQLEAIGEEEEDLDITEEKARIAKTAPGQQNYSALQNEPPHVSAVSINAKLTLTDSDRPDKIADQPEVELLEEEAAAFTQQQSSFLHQSSRLKSKSAVSSETRDVYLNPRSMTPKSGSKLTPRMAQTVKERRLSGLVANNQKSGSILSLSDLGLGELPIAPDEGFEYRDVAYSEMMEYYNPKWYAIVGFIASIFASMQLPLFGFVLSKFIFILAIPSENNYSQESLEDFVHKRNIWTGVFVALCVGIGLSTYVQKLCFGIGGENLTQTLRLKLFEAILRKNVGWFDSKSRAPGILTNILTEDISAVNGLTTETLGIATEACLGLLFSCAICFVFSWQLALVVSATSPFMVLGGLGISKLQFNQKAVDDSYKQANALLSDIIINYRTCISFGDKNLQFILNRYNELLIIPHKAGIKRAHISGLFFGYSQSIRFAFIAFVFYIAAVFINRYGLNSEQVFTGCYVVFVGSIGSGVSISQMPSVSKAKASARTVFGIIEEPSLIDPKQPGIQRQPTGAVEFKNLYFRYPSRNQYVLRNFNLKIQPNQSVAIVGHSGSGKSTIASLLLRFYDCQRGQVCYDGVNIRDYDLESLRTAISIVQQEPLLFNETIKSNILFGDLNATDQKIKEVAIQANALNFIMQSDEDYHSPAVQARVRDLYKTVCREQLDERHVKLGDMLRLCEDGTIDYRSLLFVVQLLPKLSNIGLEALESQFGDLILSLKTYSKSQDCNWKMVLKGFDFQAEVRKIESQLGARITVNSSSPEVAGSESDIRECIFKNIGEFDSETVRSFLESGKNIKFSAYLKQDRARVEQYYSARFASFVNQVRVKAYERELDPGFMKMCGLKGGKLSGGQKQRIAIARALIKNPRVMILDEATSALDEQSQEIVQQALDRAMEGRTSVVIAHRMSTIKKCNRIVVLHKGKVVEDGTYEELSGKPDGHFAKLEKGIE